MRLPFLRYVLGGGSGSRSFNDLRRLDLYTMHWELCPTRGEGPEDKPDAIIGPSLSYVEPYLVVFGGGDGRAPRLSPDLDPPPTAHLAPALAPPLSAQASRPTICTRST